MRAERAVRSRFWARYRRRGPARSTGDRVYLAYVVLLTVAVVGAPVVHGLLVGLREPAAAAAVGSVAARELVGAGLGVLTAAALTLGGLRGPALLTPFLLATLGSNDHPRRHTLRRPVLRAATLLTVSLLVLVAVPAVALLLVDRLSGAGLVALLLVTAAAGVLLTLAWLVGQVTVRAGWAWTLPAGVLLLTLAGSVAPALGSALPWGRAAALWPVQGTPTPDAWPALVPLGLLVALGVAVAPRLLDALAGEPLQEQARRWELASMAAITGDLGTALGRFRARPTAGRRRRVVRGRSFAVAVLCSDALAVLRTPTRAVTGAAVLLLAGWLLAAADGARGVPGAGWALAIGGAVLGYAGLGVLTDGVRQAVQALLVPRLFGVGDTRLVLLHAAAPLLVGMLTLGLGAVALVLVTDGAVGAALWAIALAPVLVAVRLNDAAKGPPPPSLSMPVITPMGDISVLGLLAWQSDAVLYAALAGWLSHAAGHTLALPLALGGLAVLVALLIGSWRGRVAEL